MVTLTRALVFMILLAGPLAAQKVSYDEFARTLEQTQRLNDEKGFDRAIKENPVLALSHYKGLVHDYLKNPDDLENHKKRKAMRDAWQRVYESGMLERYDRWLQLLDINTRRNYEKVLSALSTGHAELARLRNDKTVTRGSLETLRDSLMNIAQAFEAIGDNLDAASTWSLIAEVYNAMPDRTVQDRKDAISAMARFREHRQSWDWTTDDIYLGNMTWMKGEQEAIKAEEAALEKRREEGYVGEVRGVEAFLVADADATEITVPLEFEVQSKPKIDMCMQGGPVPLMWAAVSVAGSGPSRFEWFKGADLFMVRPSASKYGVTLDGTETDMKKNPFTPVDVANKIKSASRFFLDAGETRPYAMWFYVGGDQEAFQGVSHNLRPQQALAPVYYKSAGCWSGEVDKTKLSFYDDNSNGKLFEDDPEAYGLVDRNAGSGPDDEVHIPAFDGMKIGKGPDQPFSSWAMVGDNWFHLRGKDDGKAVGLRAVNPEYFKTGAVQMKWTGPRGLGPELLVIQGEGEFAGARFNLADGKVVPLPVGKYRLAFGRIVEGRGSRMMTANIFAGSSEAIEVEEGKTAEIAIGAPFQLDFAREGSGGKVTINAFKMRVRGSGGEVYTHVNGAAPAPEVLVARSPDGKGAKVVGEFVAMADAELVNRVAAKNSVLGINVGFYPVVKGDAAGATVLEVEVPDGQVLGLKQDKNKLFGKLLPIFK